ncbi:sensor histidine kinase [bacterium 210820-DFI.6.37]|nr:sensor histidine kinase [bacterium 210820-DFI.6.37]
MRQIGEYLKFHKKALLLFVVCTGIFTLVFFLSDIPLEAVLYAALLCLIAAAAVAGYDFYHFQRHHRELRKMICAIDAQIDHLPEPRGVIDEDYMELLRELHQQKRENETRAYIEKRDLVDYFTLWAHQIKTPISAMGLILQNKGAWAGEDDKELAAELFEVEQYVDTAMSYIRIRDVSSDLVFDEIDIDALIRRTIKKYASLFIRKKIAVDFQESGSRVITDEKWLYIVLGQILSNALKYTPEGGKITIRMEEGLLRISDTGIGIQAQDLPRVFEKGFTGENGRKFSKSTGQGLYLCKTIMDKLSHSISVDSEEGKGTTVTLGLFRENLSIM